MNAATLADSVSKATTPKASEQARAVLTDYCLATLPHATEPHTVVRGDGDLTDCASLAEAEEYASYLRGLRYPTKVRRSSKHEIVATVVATAFRRGETAPDDGASRYERASLTLHGIRKSKAFEAACAARGVRVERASASPFYYVRGIRDGHGARAACKILRDAGYDADVVYLD